MGSLDVFRIVLVKRIIGLHGKSFSFQQPQSHRAFDRRVGRCAGHLNATSKAFPQRPHKWDRGRRVKLVEAYPPFSFGNDTIRHFAKLSVLEHSSNWGFPRSRRIEVLRGYRRVAHPAFEWNRKSLKLLKVRVKFLALAQRARMGYRADMLWSALSR